jgi:DNA-binding transcriptional LysR family regulator
MDRLTGMAVFVAAVHEGSFAAAARRFGLSAAMAGKYVSAIEAQLNARLLQRSTRRLSLTDVGHAYYERCKRILDAYDEANREASDAHGIARGVLRVGRAGHVRSDAPGRSARAIHGAIPARQR